MGSTDLSFGLYLAGEGEYLRVRKGHLKVERDEDAHDFPLENLESVVVGGRARISGAAAAMLREEGVPVSFLNWSGRLQARVEPHPSRNALLRRAQVLAAEDEGRCMTLARAFVQAKLHNQRVFLMRAARRRQLDLSAPVAALAAAARQARVAADRATLMGHEGHGARAYFSAWPLLLEGTGFEWKGRHKRPPPDPVNALLSFGYTVMAARCADAAAIAGLDPYVGFLHAERGGRAELALDLLEEFRTPTVDSLVLSLINRQQLTPADFDLDTDGSCRLSASARRTFFENFARKLKVTSLHPASDRQHPAAHFPILQARLIGQVCAGHLPDYLPYLWR